MLRLLYSALGFVVLILVPRSSVHIQTTAQVTTTATTSATVTTQSTSTAVSVSSSTSSATTTPDRIDPNSLLAELIPLNVATVVPLVKPPSEVDSSRVEKPLIFEVTTSLTDSLLIRAKSASKAMFPTNVSHDFATGVYQNLTRIQLYDMTFVGGVWQAINHDEGALLLSFGKQMLIPASIMPASGILLMLLRIKFGLLGAKFQRYNVKLYKALWLGFSFCLILCISLLLTTMVVVAVAGFGLLRNLNVYAETTKNILTDLVVAANNVGVDLTALKNESLARVEKEIDRHTVALGPLVNQSVWDSLPSLIQTGVKTLKRMGADVGKTQSHLNTLGGDLRIVTKALLDVKDLFLFRKTDIDSFKANCTTPLFCDRIQSSILVAPVDEQKLSIDVQINDSQKIINDGLPGLITESSDIFLDIERLLMKTGADASLQAFQARLNVWKSAIQALVDPLLDLHQPLLNAVTRVNEAFHYRHHIAGLWNYNILYGIIIAAVLLVSIALLWALGLVCGCYYYQSIVLPLSRSLYSDCSGLLLMTVTYLSLVTSSVIIMMGTAIIIAATVGGGVICPALQTTLYDQGRVDQAVTALIEQNVTTAWKYDKITDTKFASVGLVLQVCSHDANATLLDLFHFRAIKPHDNTDRFTYLRRVYDIAAVADMPKLLQDVIMDTATQNFYQGILEKLVVNYGKILNFSLAEQKVILQTSMDPKVVDESLLELHKISDGLVSKPYEQIHIVDLIAFLEGDYKYKMGRARTKAHEVLRNISYFEAEMRILQNNIKIFMTDYKTTTMMYAAKTLSPLIKEKVNIFRQRIAGFLDQYTEYFYNQSTTQIGNCAPVLTAMAKFGDLVCERIFGDMLLLGYGLIAACLSFVPACVISVLLSRQLLILKKSDHIEDHYDRTIPENFRKLPKPADMPHVKA